MRWSDLSLVLAALLGVPLGMAMGEPLIAVGSAAVGLAGWALLR